MERAAVWLLAVMAVFWAVWAGLAGPDEAIGRGPSLILALLCLGLAATLGIRGARRRSRAHQAASRVAGRMLLMAQLGEQDDATLERIARSGGSAADVARTILQGRHLGNPMGSPRPPRSES